MTALGGQVAEWFRGATARLPAETKDGSMLTICNLSKTDDEGNAALLALLLGLTESAEGIPVTAVHSPTESTSPPWLHVATARAQLWTPDGSDALNDLIAERHLTPRTIHEARLGWTSSVVLKHGGRSQAVEGVIIPWLDGDRLTRVNLVGVIDSRPTIVELYRDDPGFYTGEQGIVPGRPLLVAENELDALLLAQELAGVASVIALGDKSPKLGKRWSSPMLAAPSWWLAFDPIPADLCGSRRWGQRSYWPKRARWAGYPDRCTSWAEVKHKGIDIRGLWADRFSGPK